MKTNELTKKQFQNLVPVEGLEEFRIDGIDAIPVYRTDADEYVVDGRELHNGVQSKQAFADWVKKRFLECDAIENRDFCSFHKIMEREIGASTRIEYIIKLDIAKEMAMLERNDIGKAVRKYFIAVDDKYKESQTQINELSPELQMFNKIFEVAARQELEQKRQAQKLVVLEEKAEKQGEVMQTVKEALTNPNKGDSFQKWVRDAISKVAQSECFMSFPNDGLRYTLAWNESYDRLDDKRPCRLKLRLETAKKNAALNGATQSQIKGITNLTIIAADRDLKPVYESVIREMLIYYCAEL